MKRYKKFVFWAGGSILLVVLVFGLLFGRDTVEMLIVFHKWDKQMQIGDEYMNSLTDNEIQVWIQRTQNYLKDAPTNLMDDQIPPDLKKLGIIKVEVGGVVGPVDDMDVVDYVWLAGMDNTSLLVKKLNDGTFQVTAFYNMYSNRVIWPKQ